MDTMTRWTWPSRGLEKYIDALENSADSGRFKTDDAGSLFIDVCERYGTRIEESILIGDSENACSVYSARGGTAHQVRPEWPTGSILRAL